MHTEDEPVVCVGKCEAESLSPSKTANAEAPAVCTLKQTITVPLFMCGPHYQQQIYA